MGCLEPMSVSQSLGTAGGDRQVRGASRSGAQRASRRLAPPYAVWMTWCTQSAASGCPVGTCRAFELGGDLDLASCLLSTFLPRKGCFRGPGCFMLVLMGVLHCSLCSRSPRQARRCGGCGRRAEPADPSISGIQAAPIEAPGVRREGAGGTWRWLRPLWTRILPEGSRERT